MHPSILTKESSLERTALSSTEFGCPLCPKFMTKTDSVIQRHLRNHSANAVYFQEKIICRCNLSCRDGGHFHCPFCDTTIIRKEGITLHLIECLKKCDVVQPTSVPPCKPPSPETHPTLKDLQEDCIASPSASVEHSYSLPPPVSPLTTDHSYSFTASPKTPTDSGQSPPATTYNPVASKEEVTEELPSSHVKCPHCSIVLYKQNLVLHIQRKHGQPRDITAKSHLKSTCIDWSNGLYAVRKTACGFSVPVHVQRKTWGEQHAIKCELEDCQYRLLVRRSSLSHSMCCHIRSLDYCSTIVTEEPLQHEVLQEMLDNHFFGDSKVEACKKRQQEAEEARVPLSVLVDLSDSKNYISLSIYEPKLFRYSTLGRVMVTHNLQKNTWHCPCAKAHISCTHKCIAKWHLFQTHKKLFMTGPPTNTPQVTAQPLSPPTAETENCEVSVSVKKIPATLPEEAKAQRALTDHPQQSFPNETKCKMCPDNPELEEAV